MFKLLTKVLGKSKRGAMLLSAAIMAMVMAVPMAGAAPVDFDGVDIGVTVPDMLQTATGFLGLFNVWVLLAAGVLFTPVLVWFIFWVIGRVRRSATRS